MNDRVAESCCLDCESVGEGPLLLSGGPLVFVSVPLPRVNQEHKGTFACAPDINGR